MVTQLIDEMIEGYFVATTKAVGVLFREELYGHALIVIYSAIDTCGLLDAPPTQEAASGASFNAWVKNYMLGYPGMELNEVDLWAARCSVLHTFTSGSDLSRAGRARELLYYTGDKEEPHVRHLIEFTRNHEDGKYLPVHYGELCEAFFEAFKSFVPVVFENCASSDAHEARLRRVIQIHPYGPAT